MAELVRGRGGEAVELGQMLLARQHQFGRGERIRKLARLLGDLERVKAGDADREHDREPDADEIDRRQHQRIVGIPGQRQVEEEQDRGAGDRQHAKPEGEAGRQRGCRDQHRCEEQERERVLEPAGEEQQAGQLHDVQRKQSGRLHRLQPLQRIGHGLERQIERGRQGDDADAGDDLDVELQPLRHDEDRGELAEHREPAQPQDGVQADMPLRGAKVGSGNFGHVGQCGGAFWSRTRGWWNHPDYKPCAVSCNSRRTAQHDRERQSFKSADCRGAQLLCGNCGRSPR
ncbi:hypothetical protein ABIE82_002444 [Bradyrhizobium diazoefficiens]